MPEEWRPPPRGVALECRKLTEPWAMPGPHCESWSLTCERGMEQLRPEPARRAMRCLQAKNRTRAICGFDVATRCVWQAMKGTRPHPAARRLCKQIVAQCAAGSRHDAPRSLDLNDCVSYLSALSCENLEYEGMCIASTCSALHCIDPLYECPPPGSAPASGRRPRAHLGY